jgi:hypothetical protein
LAYLKSKDPNLLFFDRQTWVGKEALEMRMGEIIPPLRWSEKAMVFGLVVAVIFAFVLGVVILTGGG